MNKLYNDAAVQAIANAIRAKNGSSDTYTIAEMSTALNDLSYYAKPTIENVPLATFEADGLPLNSLKVSVEAKQDLSHGAPSPTNICPISGWSEVNVTDTDDVDNPTVTQTTTISLGQTVYGGELDVVNGTSGNKLTRGHVDLSTLTWNYNTTWGRLPVFYATISDAYFSDEDNKLMCSHYPQSASASSSNTATVNLMSDMEIQIKTRSNQIYIANSNYTDVNAFVASLTDVEVTYPLATPTTLTTQPTLVKSLNGTNNLSVDCGDVIELEYFKGV